MKERRREGGRGSGREGLRGWERGSEGEGEGKHLTKPVFSIQ